MALIKCPECGKDVSDTIDACIHCGFKLKKKPIEQKATNNSSNLVVLMRRARVGKSRYVVLWALGIAFVFLIFGIFMIAIGIASIDVIQENNNVVYECIYYGKKQQQFVICDIKNKKYTVKPNEILKIDNNGLADSVRIKIKKPNGKKKTIIVGMTSLTDFEYLKVFLETLRKNIKS